MSEETDYEIYFCKVLIEYKSLSSPSGFDAPQVYYSDNFGDTGNAPDTANNLAVKKRFKDFLRQFNGGSNFSYKYRDALKRNYTLRQFWICVNLEDVARYLLLLNHSIEIC